MDWDTVLPLPDREEIFYPVCVTSPLVGKRRNVRLASNRIAKIRAAKPYSKYCPEKLPRNKNAPHSIENSYSLFIAEEMQQRTVCDKAKYPFFSPFATPSFCALDVLNEKQALKRYI